MLLTIKLHDISFYTLASAMLPCDLFEKNVQRKYCTNPQVCLICSLSHKHTLIVGVSLNSPPPPTPEHANLITSILLCVVLYCCLSNYNAQTVEGECCCSPLHSLAAAILSGYFSVGIWQTEIPLDTQVKDQTAFLELYCFTAV